MDESGITSQTVLDKTMEQIRNNDLGSFTRVNADESKKYGLVEEIKKIVRQEIIHGEQLDRNGNDLSKLHLPEERIEAIKQGLEMATYRIEIDDSVATLTFADGTDFKTIHLNTQADIDYATRMQVASIVIEGVLLITEVVGVGIEVSNEIKKVCSEEIVEEIVSSSAFELAVLKFVTEWDLADNPTSKAKALFDLLNDTNTLGILWTIIETLYTGKGWWDWIKAAAVIIAQIIAAHATGGLALFAKIALALKSAYDFANKIKNVQQLQMMIPTKRQKM